MGSALPPLWLLTEARRVPGLHPLLDRPGVAGELVGPTDPASLERVRAHVGTLLGMVFPDQGCTVRFRTHALGASIACACPEDQLNTAVDVLEAAFGPELPDLPALQAAAAAEARPALRALLRACAGLPVFWDEDDGFTAGLGRHARTWPLDALPTVPEAVAAARAVPFVFVTGTNGKTTTSRMLSAIAAAAGEAPGHTSSDGVVVNGREIARGDWTGPGAARAVLRSPEVSFAVLETARGGLMRRGLALTGAPAAAVTNISDDHLGEWGLDDLDALAWAKLGVARGLRLGGALVVHAQNPPLQRALAALLAERPDLRVLRFGDPAAEAWAADGALHLREGGAPLRLMGVDELPAAYGGRAAFNVENALCAALLARACGLSLDAVRGGLRAFRPDPVAGRGRLNRYALPGGGEALVDFAHNPDGLRGLQGLCADRAALAVLAGQAGDRPDASIDAYADALAALRPTLVVLKELPRHRRGRADGEVRARLRARLQPALGPGVPLVDVPDEVDAAAYAIDHTPPGGLALLLVHEELDGVEALLAARGATPA